MWHSYRTTAKEVLANAICAVVKFHALHDFSRHFTQIRIKIMNPFKPINNKPQNRLTQKNIDYNLKEKFKNSNIPEMNNFAHTFINWKNEIVNSFIVVSSSGNRFLMRLYRIEMGMATPIGSI